MEFPLAPAAVAALQATLALLVLATRPRARLHIAIGSLLLLQAGSTLAFDLSISATTPSDALGWARAATWYGLANPLLVLLVVASLPERERLGRARMMGLGVAALATVALAVTHAVAPELFTKGVLVGFGRTAYPVEHGKLFYSFSVAAYAALAVAVTTCARDAASPQRAVTERRQAALLGLGFGVTLGHAGATYAALALGEIPRRPLNDPFMIPAAAAVAGLVVVLAAIPRLVSPFDGKARVVAALAAALPIATGLYDGTVAALAFRGIPAPTAPLALVLVRRAAFGVILAIAIGRFGLAGFGEVTRRRVAAATLALVVAAVAIGVAGIALYVAGVTRDGIVLATALGGAAVVLSPVPLREPASRLARRVLVPESDPIVPAERVRAYAAALRAERRADGGLRAGAEERLARLRRELGLRDEDDRVLRAALGDAGADAATLLGRYRVEKELGRGANGAAHLARDLVTGEAVVLKRFHARGAAAAAMREADALRAVRHPRVVRLVDVERVGDEVFLALAYLPGGSARALLDRDGPIPPPRAAALVADALEGLAALHAAGLVHRDVKPENVLLDADGRGVVADLGSAGAAAARADATMTGDAVVGSLATVAPEVLRGAAATPRADVYGAGATLYRLLTGEHYVRLDGLDAFSARERVLTAPPRLPHPRVPPTLEPVLRRALAKRPEERYGSADELRAAVGASAIVKRTA